MKGLKLMVSHADYGQSDNGISGSSAANRQSVTDATETDIVLAYKPTKELTLKLFNAIRTSEYHGMTHPSFNGRKMNHVRAVAAYTF